jgi:RNA polymerase sigma-70 factor, ECF subfamily
MDGCCPPTDVSVIARVLEGDVDAYAVLLDRYSRYVAAIVTRHVPADRATEIVHEVFVRGYSGLPGLKNGNGFKPWISSIAVKTCCDFWRKKYHSKEIPVSDLTDNHHEWLDRVLSDTSMTDYEQLAGQKEAAETLEFGLAKLSPEDRMVVELVYLEGLSAREAADLMGWSVVNVKVRCFRARKKLENALLKCNSRVRDGGRAP